MFSTLTEYILLFVFLGIMIILWPSVSAFPLPSFFETTIIQLASTTKFLQSLPILSHLFNWIFLYIGIFFAWYLFKFLYKLVIMLKGSDKSMKL